MEASTYVAPLYRLVRRLLRLRSLILRRRRYIAETRIKSIRVDSKAIAEVRRMLGVEPFLSGNVKS